MKHSDVKVRKFKEKITRIEPGIDEVLTHVRHVMAMSVPVLKMVCGALDEYREPHIRKTVSLLTFTKEKADAYSDAALEFGRVGARGDMAQRYHQAWWKMEQVSGYVDTNTEIIRKLVEVGPRSAYDGLPEDDETEVVSHPKGQKEPPIVRARRGDVRHEPVNA